MIGVWRTADSTLGLGGRVGEAIHQGLRMAHDLARSDAAGMRGYLDTVCVGRDLARIARAVSGALGTRQAANN